MIPRIGFGTAGLVDGGRDYSRQTSESEALQTIERILSFGPCLLDTSRNYGGGRGEELIGLALQNAVGTSSQALIATKIDRNSATNLLDTRVFHQSLRDSIKAIGIDSFGILFVHDPEYAVDWTSNADAVLGELVKVREWGLADQVGIASGNLRLVFEAFERADLDCALVHNRYTLINRSAEPLFAELKARGKSVINAAPFGGGALAKGAGAERYVYQAISDDVRASLADLQSICHEFGVDLRTAAMHFSLKSPLVDCTVVGATTPAQFDGLVAALVSSVPGELLELLGQFRASRDDPESSRWTNE